MARPSPTHTKTDSDHQLDVRMLGGFAIAYQGQALPDLNGQRPQLFLAYLLLHRDRQVTRQEIAFLFWPDASERQARTNFRNLLHRLRRLFPSLDEFVWTDNTRIGWQTDRPMRYDVQVFERLLAEAETAL